MIIIFQIKIAELNAISNTYYFHGLLTNKGVTMKKHYPKLESVSKVIETLLHPQCKSIAKAIWVRNDKKTDLSTKLCAVALVFI